MHLSVIVPAFNESAGIVDTLQRLQSAVEELESENASCEIIVVDDESTDDTAELARAQGCTVVTGSHTGIGAARNTGAQASSGHYLVFVDADTAVPSNLLLKILDATRHGLVAGPVIPVYRPLRWWHGPYFAAWRAYARRHNMAQGVCQVFERSLFFHLGGYNEELRHAEDTDLHWRSVSHQQSVRAAGTVRVVPDVVVYPSMRRYEQSSFWWTVMKLNPVTTSRNLTKKTAWSEWYENPPR